KVNCRLPSCLALPERDLGLVLVLLCCRSLVNGTFSEIKDRMFSHLPSLQLLLLNSNSFTVIRDDAFAGLFHLEYLFIEGNKIETISRNAFRGLRDLTHLDLRGNKFECDCKAKWLYLWLKMTNSTVSDVLCLGPPEYQEKKLNDVASFDYECTTTGRSGEPTAKGRPFSLSLSLSHCPLCLKLFHRVLQAGKFKVRAGADSVSGEGPRCTWSHSRTNAFPSLSHTGQSIVGCKAILIDDQVFVVVAQLFGGSHIYRYDESWTKFVKFQDIEVSRISKPNDIELFQIEDETFFIIADSSKAGLSTVYKWNSKGFYSYQSLHEWFRDTDAEFVDIDGKSHLILSSRSQVPIILQWNKSSKKFVPHSDIPHMEDVLAVKSFRMQNALYLSLTRFIGDSRVMKWNSKQFVEIQALPSRGAMTLQPFSFKENHYLALGSDYTFSQIYQWDKEKQLFKKFKEIYVQAPRSFTAVSTDRRDFFFASSFKGKTKIFEHIIVDLSL
uniref:Leucine rich repeat LGI family member 2 n=1 Tax=Oryctolagus cuniculus TaxID=9986 RepID=A0A5F9DLF8_RABIT